jgi:BASS family bile acid:Na+ symporter
MKQAVDILIPAITFLLLTAVGLDLTTADFARMRRNAITVGVGLLAPLVVLPLLALGLIAVFHPEPAIEAGLLLIAACPIGGISNTYSYLARASTALSVTLTGVSCLLAVVTIPLLTRVFELVIRRPLRFDAPARVLLLQLLFMLALPVWIGMGIRRRWPAVADARRGVLQRLAFAGLALLIVFVVWAEWERFAAGLWTAVSMSAVFVLVSFAIGWLTASVIRATPSDRFTLAAEFATRNVAVATAIAVTILGRVDFAVFATTYFLTELPLMLVLVAGYRRVSRP